MWALNARVGASEMGQACSWLGKELWLEAADGMVALQMAGSGPRWPWPGENQGWEDCLGVGAPGSTLDLFLGGWWSLLWASTSAELMGWVEFLLPRGAQQPFAETSDRVLSVQ